MRKFNHYPEDALKAQRGDEEFADIQVLDTLKPARDIIKSALRVVDNINQVDAIAKRRQQILDNTKHVCLVCGHKALKGHTFCSKGCEYEHHSLEDGCRHNREEEREEKQ